MLSHSVEEEDGWIFSLAYVGCDFCGRYPAEVEKCCCCLKKACSTCLVASEKLSDKFLCNSCSESFSKSPGTFVATVPDGASIVGALKGKDDPDSEEEMLFDTGSDEMVCKKGRFGKNETLVTVK